MEVVNLGVQLTSGGIQRELSPKSHFDFPKPFYQKGRTNVKMQE